MKFAYFPLSKAHQAYGTVVVIDVLRAFTTAAYAFSKGVKKIIAVSSISEANLLKEKFPGCLTMGEAFGNKPEGFNLSNSPEEISKINLSNKTIIHRTSAGTQGLVRTKSSADLLAASFVVAKPTSAYLKQTHPYAVSFIITGNSLGRDGDEDLACAEYITCLVQDQDVDSEKFLSRIFTSSVGRAFVAGDLRYLSEEDVKLSAQANLFNFVMEVHKMDNLLVMSHNYY